jgi:hypothetical protein
LAKNTFIFKCHLETPARALISSGHSPGFG